MNGHNQFGPSLQEQATTLVNRIKPMTNQELKDILRAESLPITGVKAVLQKRIIDRKMAQ